MAIDGKKYAHIRRGPRQRASAKCKLGVRYHARRHLILAVMGAVYTRATAGSWQSTQIVFVRRRFSDDFKSRAGARVLCKRRNPQKTVQHRWATSLSTRLFFVALCDLSSSSGVRACCIACAPQNLLWVGRPCRGGWQPQTIKGGCSTQNCKQLYRKVQCVAMVLAEQCHAAHGCVTYTGAQ